MEGVWGKGRSCNEEPFLHNLKFKITIVSTANMINERWSEFCSPDWDIYWAINIECGTTFVKEKKRKKKLAQIIGTK